MLKNSRRWRPSVIAGLLMLVFASVCVYRVNRVVHNPDKTRGLIANDSKHYLEIARSLSHGDFSFSYVVERAHRQPLYPMLLAPVMVLGGEDNLFLLASVNVLLATLAMGVAYLIGARLFHSPWAGVVVAALLGVSQFMIDNSTKRLLTEPLHVLLMLGVIVCFSLYLRERKSRWLLFTVVGTGLDYLARPNGLFVTASALAVLALADLRTLRSTPAANRLRSFLALAGRYALSLALLILITTPSWLPRAIHVGNPFDHGNLDNYLWTDTYEEGHIDDDAVAPTWRDYVATHTLGDMAARWMSGSKNVFFQIPAKQEGTPLLYLLAVAGAVIALRFGPTYLRYLVLFLVLQLLPLIWTNLSNPIPRVPYGALLPFELVFAAFLLAWTAQTMEAKGGGPSDATA